jgi:hypothetical protein
MAEGAAIPVVVEMTQLVPPSIVHPLVVKFPPDQSSKKEEEAVMGVFHTALSDLLFIVRFVGGDLTCNKKTEKEVSWSIFEDWLKTW